jgi:hypothetical protein
MRLLLFILGVFATIICIEKPAEARDYPWCAYYGMGWVRRRDELRVRNVGTMPSRHKWSWRFLWSQSHVPAPTRNVSLDQTPATRPLSLLGGARLTREPRQLGDIRRNPPRLSLICGHFRLHQPIG